MFRNHPRLTTAAAASAVVLLLSACSSTSASTSTQASASAPSHVVAAEVLTHNFAWGNFTLAPRIVDKLKAGQKLNIVDDIQGTALPIMGAEMRIGMQRGCDAAQSRLPLNCRLTGPVTTNAGAQLAELETLLNGNQVDCLGLQSPLPDQYVDVINKYVAAGIPVFTFNNDALSEKQAGSINGAQTAQLIKSQGLKINTIAMGSGQPSGPWAQNRMAGFEEGYKTVFPNAKFFNDSKSGIPTGDNFTTKEVLNSVGPFLQAHPDVNLFFHTDQGVEGVGLIIKNQKLTGKVWTSGFNVSGPILDSIDSGSTLVTIDQGFDNQAEAPVNACVDYLTTGSTPTAPLQYLKPIVITKAGGDGLQTPAEARVRLQQATTK
jgi:ABC-type sugar transport system substrate-binding protein